MKKTITSLTDDDEEEEEEEEKEEGREVKVVEAL